MKLHEHVARLEKVAEVARDLDRLLGLSVISPIAIQAARQRLQIELQKLPALADV